MPDYLVPFSCHKWDLVTPYVCLLQRGVLVKNVDKQLLEGVEFIVYIIKNIQYMPRYHWHIMKNVILTEVFNTSIRNFPGAPTR